MVVIIRHIFFFQRCRSGDQRFPQNTIWFLTERMSMNPKYGNKDVDERLLIYCIPQPPAQELEGPPPPFRHHRVGPIWGKPTPMATEQRGLKECNLRKTLFVG